jgi:thioredoxin-like negative regulator of GroEL
MKKFMYFSAPWCGPCRQFGPVMERISQSGIPVEKINVDNAPQVAAAYIVKSIPTTILVDEKGQEISRFVGVKSEQQIKEIYG